MAPPVQEVSQETVSSYGIGIDFGASTCVIGMCRSGVADVIPNEMGNRTTACAVAFTKEERPLAGDAAHNAKDRNLSGTVRGFKKLLGQEFDDENTQEDISEDKVLKAVKIVKSENGECCAVELPYKQVVSAADGSVSTPRNNQEEDVTPVSVTGTSTIDLELCATMLFRKVKETTDLYLGENTTHCVLSIPSHYSVERAEIVKNCCEATGMAVMRMIKDPVAALIAYGLDTKQSEKSKDKKKKAANSTGVSNALVFDMGGSTIDVSAFQINNASGLILPIASSGHGSMGSRDVDALIYDFCFKDLRRKDKKSAEALKTNLRAQARLSEACALCKKALSASNTACVEVESLINDVDCFVNVSRAVLDDMLEKSEIPSTIEEILDEVIEKFTAKTGAEIDTVCLIGGGSNLSKIQSVVKAKFPKATFPTGNDSNSSIPPVEAVALGSAIQADLLLNTGDTYGSMEKIHPKFAEADEPEGEDEDPVGIAVESKTLSAAIGIKTNDAKNPVLTVFPRDFCTPADIHVKIQCANQKAASLEIVEFTDVAKLKKIATIVLPNPEGKTQIDCDFNIDAEGVLKVTACGKTTVCKK